MIRNKNESIHVVTKCLKLSNHFKVIGNYLINSEIKIRIFIGIALFYYFLCSFIRILLSSTNKVMLF